ncbi:MAG: PilZ domain-containing protein [Planctomycetota bacterium]|jgi:hypothetical protein
MSDTVIPSPVVPQPPAELVSFVERNVRDARSYSGPERRMERRYLMAVPVLAQHVDERSSALGDPFAVVSRNISPTGIGLVHTKPIEQTLLAIQMFLADEEVNLVVDVVWCKPLGPFYYFGGTFVKKLPSFPCPAEVD